MRRVLVINPNTSKEMTKHIGRVLKKVKFRDTVLKVVDLERGPKTIESSYDVGLAVPEMLKIIERESKEFNAILIACFADPGLEAAREICQIPVLGIMEASIYVASMLGEKFSILSINKRRAPTKWRYVRSLGLSGRMASVVSLDMPVVTMERDKGRLMVEIERAVEKAVKDGAEVIILGCAAMAGYSKEIEERVGIPVVDPIVVGFKMAEIFADIGLCQSKVGCYSTPTQGEPS